MFPSVALQADKLMDEPRTTNTPFFFIRRIVSNLFHATSGDWLGVLALKLSQPKRLSHHKSKSTAFLSTDMAISDIPMFRAALSNAAPVIYFSGALRKHI
jgi:hypothetical protein